MLICFLAYYLVKKLELELKAKNITHEVEPLLRHWDTLQVGEVELIVKGQSVRRERNWL